ncbi:MAG: alanine:cation symporter family protein [Lachnospiraceae bacterium]|nr:alanine:cation symporter family protein [Lachnospiraceae bacterium]
MEKIALFLSQLDELIWGPWLITLIIGTGIFLMIRMHFLPIRNFFYALRLAVGWKPWRHSRDISDSSSTQVASGTPGFASHKETSDSSGPASRQNTSADSHQTVFSAAPASTKPKTAKAISPLSSLTTELAATIGTGNIVGVATAMILGGPGALVWMLISSVIGLSTKFAESTLSVKYRTKNADGQFVGGPMYTLSHGFPLKRLGKILAVLFAFFAVFASFGMGNMTQSNSIALALKESFDISEGMTGLILTILVILVILGGIGSISKITLWLVPAMALIYILGSLAVIFANFEKLGEGLAQIFTMAFSKKALAGGFGGGLIVTLQDTLRYGISRGVFSNEAGLGAGGITAAAADTDSPARQGYISMTGIFFDTILICSLTGLVLACSGVLGMRDASGELLTGSALAIAAFSSVFGDLGGDFVSAAISLFAFATIIAWEYQGEKAFEYLVKRPGRCLWYRFIYGLVTFVGAVCSLEVVWDFSDIMNGLMAVPNLICILVMSETVRSEIFTHEESRHFRHQNSSSLKKEHHST